MARKALSSREIIRQLKSDGWAEIRTSGSHHHFRHAVKPGLVTVPHPKRTLPKGTIRGTERQAGITFK